MVRLEAVASMASLIFLVIFQFLYGTIRRTRHPKENPF